MAALMEDANRTPLGSVLPPLIFGTATFNTQFNPDPFALDTNGLVLQALASGIRAFDTSPYYGPSEELLGKALNTPQARADYPRREYHILTKVGRIAANEFDYSPSWIRSSIARSLKRLQTSYLDVVYCHDVEFVSQEEAIEAVKELRRIRDQEGSIKYVGISGYPLEVLCQISERILLETGEPLDIVQSYAHFNLQNTTLSLSAVPRLKAAKVGVVTNASVLGMGLLRREGPPEWHPAGRDLRSAVRKASDFCDGHDERLEVIAVRYALETWIKEGAVLGSFGDPASGVPSRKETIAEVGGTKLGVSVIGVSNAAELTKTLRIWRSILDGLEGGQELANAAGRWKKDHEWSKNRQKAVKLLAEGIQDLLNDFLDYDWPSPPPGFMHARLSSKHQSTSLPSPETSPYREDPQTGSFIAKVPFR